MTAAIDYTDTFHGALVVDYTGEAAIGLQGNILNPEGCTLIVIESYLWLITAATLAATINIGFGTTGLDQSELHSAFPLNGGALTAWMGLHPAVTQDASLAVLWLATEFLTFTTAAQSALPCVAKLFIKYLRVP
ncbi:MAG: hypothetical protein A2Y53_06980 [Chloroflexi bacterium RBG_16_47_49]|nr:MAG: hypothetical protein A2Y53_06980 [Chloroflexi bacterium RBG_16_47_49]